jgi:hypothetical protein
MPLPVRIHHRDGRRKQALRRPEVASGDRIKSAVDSLAVRPQAGHMINKTIEFAIRHEGIAMRGLEGEVISRCL